MFLQQAPFINRDSLGTFLNGLGLLGVGVEVGTHRGDFAKIILETWEGATLYCVDPWSIPPGYEGQAETLWGGTSRDADYLATKGVLAKYPGRGRTMKATSREASTEFPNSSLDFVYLDGDHRREFVAEDLNLWWPKIKSGGILAGHDFICPGEPPTSNWGNEIQPAVMEFATKHKLTVFLIVENLCWPWSYYLMKP